MDSVMEEEDGISNAEDSIWTEQVDISELCRVCANPNEHLIPIFHGEGLEHDLDSKISKHLPIKIKENDKLPAQLCYQCASTLIAWHDMVVGCIEANERLRSLIADEVDDEDEAIQNSSEANADAKGETLISNSNAEDIVLDPQFKTEEFIVDSEIQILDSAFETNEVVEDQLAPEEEASDATSDPRFLESFAVYHQVQEDKEMQQLSTGETALCTLCIALKESSELMISEHKITCGHCRTSFTNTNELSEHMHQHCSEYLGLGDQVECEVESKVSVKLLGETEEEYWPTTKVIKGKGPKRSKMKNETEVLDVYDAEITYFLDVDCKSELEDDVNHTESDGSVKNYDIKRELKHGLQIDSPKPTVIRRSKKATVDHMDVEIVNKAKLEINGTIVYHCDICQKNVTNRNGYVRHMRIHTGERPFTCHICGKQFKGRVELKMHIKFVHEKVKNHACETCGKCFATKISLGTHRLTHTTERPFICDICGKAFRVPNNLYIHGRVHKDYYPHQCTVCGKLFRTKQYVDNHMRVHTGEKPYKCEICGKLCRTRSDYVGHRQIHTNEKPYVCSFCGVAFGVKRYLAKHVKRKHSTTKQELDA